MEESFDATFDGHIIHFPIANLRFNDLIAKLNYDADHVCIEYKSNEFF